MEQPTLTSPERTETVARATSEALRFATAKGLPLPHITVDGISGLDYEARVSVAFIRDPGELLAWAAAVGAATVAVQARPVDTCAWVSGTVDGVRYEVAGSLPHAYGAVHLPGAGVVWDSGRYARITLAQFEVGMRGSGYLTGRRTGWAQGRTPRRNPAAGAPCTP